MSKRKSFQDVLVEFFNEHDEKNVSTAAKIAKRFRGKEKTVIEHLCKKYDVDPESIDFAAPEPVAKKKKGAAAAAPSDAAAASGDAEAPKSKKNLFIIIGAVALVAALAGGYVMFMGGDDAAHGEEAAPTEEGAVDGEEGETAGDAAGHEPEPEPEPEVVEPAAVDSTETDSTAEEGDDGH